MRNPEWKQAGPKDQSVALLMSLLWFVEMLELYPETAPAQDVLDKIKTRVDDIKDLCRSYLPEEW